MKVSCLQEHFAKGLSLAGRAVATRTTLPITTHILLATDEGRLRLSATNLEIALTCWLGAQVEEEGTVTVPARLLTEFVGSLANERIDLTLPPRTRQLRLVCSRNQATINGMDPEDFPPFPEIRDGTSLFIDPKVLHRALNHVVFAAATDDSRPVLTGVHVLLAPTPGGGSGLTLAAADGFRLAVHSLALEEPVADRMEIIIPGRTLRELERLLSDQEEPLEMVANAARTQVLFRLKNVELVSQLIQGTFPNYQQLIPDSAACRAVAARSEFLRQTKIAAIFARDASGIVRLQMVPEGEMGAGRLIVSAKAEEVGDNVGEMDAIIEGEGGKIAFNSRYLQEVLQVLDCERVALETSSPSSPGVIRPVDTQDYVHVVMPMFVQW